MDVTVREDERGLVLELSGALDDGAAGVVRAAAEVARADHRRLLVDVSDASGLDVATLDHLSDIAAGAGGRVLIRA